MPGDRSHQAGRFYFAGDRNYTIRLNFHWGLHSNNIAAISKKAEQKLAQLLPLIMKGRRVYFTRNNLWEALRSIVILGLYPIFPIAYLLVGKLFMAKVMFSNNRCVGCGRCARFCSNQAIEMRSVGKNLTLYALNVNFMHNQ